jgi:glycosyltransferase involved in cell wall biosynthesis
VKILIVANGFVRAGVSRVLSLISQEWAKENEVSISIFKKSEFVYPLGGEVVQHGIPLRSTIASQVYHLYRLLKKNNYDKIYGFSEDANYPLAIAAKLAGVNDKTVLTVHNPVQKFSMKVQSRVKKHYSSVGQVIAVSNGVREGLINLGVSPEKVVFKPNPIDLQMVDEKLKDSALVGLNLIKENINFVGVGRLHKHKGFDILINAFSEVLNFLPYAHLTIVGDGEERINLETKITQLKLQNKVTLMGAVENPFAIVKASDVYVMSSRLEGWPLVLMEAMAVGKPVISFSCPNGPDEIIQDATQGILVESENESELAKEMIKLASERDKWDSMSKESRKRMESFDVSVIAKKWLV